MTLRASSLPGWYNVSQDLYEQCKLIPGRRAAHGALQLHRTHLPLVDDIEAARICALPPIDMERRNARDQHTGAQGFKLRGYQHDAVDFVQRCTHGALIGDEPRLGKGQPLSARVLTPTGWRLMGSLKVGDKVIDPDGGHACVQGIYPQGIKRVYRVTTTDGGVTECDEEHLWLVQTSRREWAELPPRVFATKDLAKNLRLKQQTVAKSGIPPARWILPLTQPIQFAGPALNTQEADLPLDPYTLGALLGDGSFRNRTVRFTNASKTLQARVRAGVQRLGCTTRCTRSKNTIEARIVSLGSGSNPLVTLMRRFGLMGAYSSTKFVPVEYLYASIEARRALLAGLLDTDGEVTDGTTQYSTTSDQLRDQVSWLVRSLGGLAWSKTDPAPTYRYKGELRVGQPCHTVTITISENPFRLPRKAVKWTPGQRRRKIASIKYVRREQTQCIRVSSKRSLYITDDFIVTHNTVTALMTHDPSLGRLVIISPLMVREVWLGWIKRVFPGEDVGLMVGKKFDKEIASKPIVIGHPALLATWGTDMPVGTFVLDEAHDYSNYKSRRSVGASMIASRAKRMVALTGTPVYNKIIGMWFMLSMLEPGAWGGYDDFGKRYCAPEYTAWGPRYVGSSNSDELSQRLTQIMIRRRHAEVQKDLPPMSRETIVADLTPSQRRQIDFAAEGLRKSARTNTAGELARYRAAIGAAKVDTTVEYGMKILRRDEPLVVWAWHKATANHLEVAFREAGATTFVVHGDVTPVAKREALISAWKAAPPSVLIITIAIGQVGIDLSHAQYALVVEIDYTPALMEQMEMRIFNALRPSYLTYIVVDHMTDRRMAMALIAKLSKTKPLDMQAAEQMINLLEVMFGEPADDGDMNRLMRALLEHEDGVV